MAVRDRFCAMAAAVLVGTAAASCFGAAFDSESWKAKSAAHLVRAKSMRAAYVKCAAQVRDPAKDVKIPIESHADGTVKTLVTADEAQFFLQEGLVYGAGVVVRQFAKDGREMASVTAEKCVIDREKRCGWIEGHSKARYRDEVDIEGDGVYISFPDEYVRVASNTVVTAGARSLKGDNGQYDRKVGVVDFDGKVEVVQIEKGEEYVLHAGKATAILEGTNDVRRVVAYEGVVITNGTRVGECDRAVYSRKSGKIVLFGADGRKAVLSESGKRKGDLKGSRIVFWLDSEQVEVADSEITIETNGLQLPKGR